MQSQFLRDFIDFSRICGILIKPDTQSATNQHYPPTSPGTDKVTYCQHSHERLPRRLMSKDYPLNTKQLLVFFTTTLRPMRWEDLVDQRRAPYQEAAPPPVVLSSTSRTFQSNRRSAKYKCLTKYTCLNKQSARIFGGHSLRDTGGQWLGSLGVQDGWAPVKRGSMALYW